MLIRLKVRVTPNAPKNAVVSWTEDEIRLKIKAPAVEGKANAALIEYLSELTGVPRAKIQLKAGEKSRIKLVEIDGPAPDEVRARIISGMLTHSGPAARRVSQTKSTQDMA